MRTCGTPARTAEGQSMRDNLQSAFNVNSQSVQYSIPVVWHIVGTQAFRDYITDGMIYNNLRQLNLDFRSVNPDITEVPDVFKPSIMDRDGFNFVTRQINRVDDSRTTWDLLNDDTLHNNLKCIISPAVDVETTLNVWVLQDIGGNLGFAFFPESIPHNGCTTSCVPADCWDGVVLAGFGFGGSVEQPSPTGVGDFYAFYNPYNLGRTLTHEVGHYFGLSHMWGDGDPDSTSCTNTLDLPFQSGANAGSPTFPEGNCAQPSVRWEQADGSMFMNYMDYVFDESMIMLADQQADEMLLTLGTMRTGFTAVDNSIVWENVDDVQNSAGTVDKVYIGSDQVYPAASELITDPFNLTFIILNGQGSAVQWYSFYGSNTSWDIQYFENGTWNTNFGDSIAEFDSIPVLYNGNPYYRRSAFLKSPIETTLYRTRISRKNENNWFGILADGSSDPEYPFTTYSDFPAN